MNPGDSLRLGTALVIGLGVTLLRPAVTFHELRGGVAR